MQLPDAEAVEVELPHMKTTIDLTKPVWFGPYQGAKLGVFEGQNIEWLTQEAKFTFENSVTYFAIMTELADGGDFIVYGHYGKEVPPEEIVAHIQSITYIQYLKQKQVQAPSSYMPGPTTLQ